ncbi:Hypothetical protein NAEGRDRAFT_58999 [Naegleria gruberi]|uniref:Uncharacterized protein n=1 Tax=Naegleria gruberi TaxID=5762 RepID=D2VR85_NAEGR|nr:uncharacterized protein NAEGRDRAFT_58999 [Naegleria gruberi]EFC40561.1 Hypothetical protein NAEGRDRAFT_58999 [Naegleria gruberi]|eukprot:XP_002673305.1 Hypothetical protein NAEGRDRAFT_58999 [Naegleria gruberi strain NEG-M]
MSTRKNKSKAAAPKRKNQSDEDESSTDTDNDSEPSKKKQFKPSSSKQLVKTVKKTMSVHDSDSDESTTEDSENGTGDSTESVYFQVRHVNGKREYVIVPEHVDYIFDLIDKDKAFPEFINAIIQCEKVLTDLTKRFAHLFSGLAFNTTVNGITYSIPPDIIKMLIGNVTQKQCLELLAHHHFKKPIGELTTDQRTVCRKFFEARGWDKESVRKAINSLIKE